MNLWGLRSSQNANQKLQGFLPYQTNKDSILCFDIKLTHKWQFYDHFRQFLCKCMFIFHKTEVQTVILICLMGLNSDWFKNYDTKCKSSFSLMYVVGRGNGNICNLSHNSWTNQNLDPFSISKWLSELQFCER